MSINISPDDINKLVSEAILKSAIGETLKASIDRNVAELSKSYNNPFDVEIKRVISAECYRVVNDVFGEKIKDIAAEKVRAQLTDDVIENVIKRAVEAAIKAVERY